MRNISKQQCYFIAGGAATLDETYIFTSKDGWNDTLEITFDSDAFVSLSQKTFRLNGPIRSDVFSSAGIALSPTETIYGIRNSDNTTYTLHTVIS